jgi:hypothetical protein
MTRTIPRDDAKLALCMLPRLEEDQPYEAQLLPGYIAYVCPGCDYAHQIYDSPMVRRMLEWFPDNKVIERHPHVD